MSDICSTVRIKTTKGYADLNASDFDPERYELFETVDPVEPVESQDDEVPADSNAPVDPLADLGTGWKREKNAEELRAIAESISGRTPSNKTESIEVIEAELDARAAPSKELPPPPVI